MLKINTAIFLYIFCLSFSWSKAIIDPDVSALINARPLNASSTKQTDYLSTIIFLDSEDQADLFINDLKLIKGVIAKKFDSIPAVLVLLPKDPFILKLIATHPAAMQISSFHGGHEELEFSEQAILLRSSFFYPYINNWWENGYRGQHGIIGIIDSGIAVEHPSLEQNQFIVRKESGSGYESIKNGVRSAHGTGVACIYAGSGSAIFPNDLGLAHGASKIITGFAGEGDGNMQDIAQTLSTLDWMLHRSELRPDVINYSFGNGPTNCAECTDWSGLAKVVDYVVNHYHILWVKSAGNGGYIRSSPEAPFASTMTTPADNYNALTVANMNPTHLDTDILRLNPSRESHAIRYTSSRGPTLNGRKKPDISAPGNDTRTCAPDPAIYSFSYLNAMDYHDGYRLMGGTSSAAPHVGAASLLLHDAGITSPMAKKALLINSADAYTDGDEPGPDDPKYPYKGGHAPVMGSEWNRTYGWGYLNMQRAYDERRNLVHDKLTLKHPEKEYLIDLPVGGKVTLIHERRVGYSNSFEWKLSHLSLELLDNRSKNLVMSDDSAHNTVHQVANCERGKNEKVCSSKTKFLHAVVRISLLNKNIDGANEEPFVLAWSGP